MASHSFLQNKWKLGNAECIAIIQSHPVLLFPRICLFSCGIHQGCGRNTVALICAIRFKAAAINMLI